MVRVKPNLKSNKIAVITYNQQINILASTKIYDSIILSSNEKVVGEWKHIFYKNKEGQIIDGYVIDRFITYDIEDAYFDTNNVVNIYNEKQFFDNLKNNTTLNIKSKKLDLAKYIDNSEMLRYLEENAYDISFEEIKFSNGNYDNDYQTQKYQYVRDSGVKKIFLHDCRNIQITSDHATEIKTYPLIFKKFHHALFNNIIFKTIGETKEYNEDFRIYKSSNIYFSNINFVKKQTVAIEERSKQINFNYCSFDNKSSVRVSNSNATFEKCKFIDKQENQIKFIPETGVDGSKLQLTNSYITKETVYISPGYYTSHEYIENNNTYH